MKLAILTDLHANREAVQAVLHHAAEHPTVIAYTDVWRQLEALEKAGCWPATSAYALLDVQRAYRSWRHRAMLRGEPMQAADGDFANERDAQDWAERNNLDVRDLHYRSRGSRGVTLSVRRSALGDSATSDLSYGRRTGFF